MNKLLKHPAILIILLTLIPSMLLMLMFSSAPINSFIAFFTGPFSNVYSFGNMLNSSAPLMLTSLGALIALKSNSFNLGGEGQVLTGATVTGLLLNSLPGSPSLPTLVTTIIITLSITGFITWMSAWLDYKYRVDSLISTYLISMASIHICNYFITGPFLKENSNLLTTKKISEIYWLEKILTPSTLSTGFIIAVFIVILLALIFHQTLWGYEFNISGRNRDFAYSMGINNKVYRVMGLTLSGVLHGAAGVLLVLGNHHAVIYGFHANLGWNGLSSALVAGSRPVMVLLSSLFYAYLDAGASYATIVSDTTIELSAIIKSVIFFVISSRIIKERLIKRSSI